MCNHAYIVHDNDFIKVLGVKMSIIRSVKNQINASRFDFHLLRKYGMYSVKKNWENREYHKCPSKSAMDAFHLPVEQELEKQRKTEFHEDIKISIITPLYNTPEKFLTELIDSVTAQTYSNWELCLADGSDGEHTYVGDICKNRLAQDSRIAYHLLEKNEGISGNTNECIRLATGNYFALLDHDDLLHPSALYEVAKAIEEKGADFVYTDEVKFKKDIYSIDNPIYFNLKPGFSKYDLRSHNFICHLTVFSKSLLDTEEVFYRQEFDGSQDHDMVLRMTEKAHKIVHIPKVLYYWRVHENSVSMDLGVKSYAVDSAFRAVKSQLERNGEKGKISNIERLKLLYRIDYEMKNYPRVSIVLHGSDGKEVIAKAVNSIIDQTNYPNYEIIYASSTVIEDIEDRGISVNHVDISEREGITERWNHAIEKATGEHIVLMDMKVYPKGKNWLREMMMYSVKDDTAIVGSKIYYEDETIAYAGISMREDFQDKLYRLCIHDSVREDGYEAMLLHVRRVCLVTAECMLFEKKIWDELNGFDNVVPEYEDIDFCIRAIENNNRINVWTPFAEMFTSHREINGLKSPEAITVFEDKYRQAIEKDDTSHPVWDKFGLV